MPKNIENCKRIQIKKRFHIFVSARLWKCTADLSFDCRLFYPIEMVLTQHGSTLLNWCLKTLKTVKKSNKETFPYFRKCTFMKTHCRFISWLSIILSYRNGFNSTWPNITELMPKNIENCKKIQIKKRFHLFLSARLWKCTADLSFNCWLFYPIKMVLIEHDPTLLNWCLKTLKTVKEFK